MAQMVVSPIANMKALVRGPATNQSPQLPQATMLQTLRNVGARGMNGGVGRISASAAQFAGGSLLGPGHMPGPVSEVHSLPEFQKFVEENEDSLVVLKCKANSCRPCKAFARKYSRIAAEYPNVKFATVTGDETMETRGMMVKMQVKSTPTFLMYTNGELVHKMTGANKDKLIGAIQDLVPGELDSSMPEDQFEGGLQMKLQGA